MKKTFKLFVTLFLLAVSLGSAYAQIPTFDMTVRNIKTTNAGGQETGDTLTFEVWLRWTNFGTSDRFEFAAAQYTWLCNRAILASAPGLKLELQTTGGGSPLPATYRPPTFQVDSLTAPPGQLYLKGSGNNPNSANAPYIVSANPPFGAKILTFRLVNLSGQEFPIVPFDLRFKLGPAPNTFVAYFVPVTVPDTEAAPPQLAVSLMDTVTNHYTVESPFVLPVELANFTSNVNKNNVSLAWTTSTETNNQGFDIERKLTGTEDWSKVGNVAGNGTTTAPKDYTFSDRATTGNYNYRLKQIDFNGSINYHALSGEVIVGLPTVYAISQNYPNPFNPSTKIDFELPYDSKVSILLYDISGREVGKIVNEQLTAGYHNVQFNGSNLASGMYFYRINANGGSQNFITTKKMVLIK